MRELSYDKEGMLRSTVLALLSNICILSLSILLQNFLKEENIKGVFSEKNKRYAYKISQFLKIVSGA